MCALFSWLWSHRLPGNGSIWVKGLLLAVVSVVVASLHLRRRTLRRALPNEHKITFSCRINRLTTWTWPLMLQRSIWTYRACLILTVSFSLPVIFLVSYQIHLCLDRYGEQCEARWTLCHGLRFFLLPRLLWCAKGESSFSLNNWSETDEAFWGWRLHENLQLQSSSEMQSCLI